MPESATPTRTAKAVGCAIALACAAAAIGCFTAPAPPTPATAAAPAVVSTAPPRPALFHDWPKAQQPDLVFVLTGQTHGYLSPCGCSHPQKGGLERRANLMDALRAKGWPVVGLDLGDVSPEKGLRKQNVLKYATTMAALREMGYAAVGLGEHDFAADDVYNLLLSIKAPELPPVVLAANLLGVQRGPDGKPGKPFTLAEMFPSAKARPMVEPFEVVAAPGRPAFGVVSVVGPTAAAKVEKIDSRFSFIRDDKGEKFLCAAVIQDALNKFKAHPAKPELRVLMYAGTLAEAKVAAEVFPDDFQVVLCQSDESEPPASPVVVNGGKTRIVQVGHKGQNVGVLGVYRTATGFDLRYQLVALTEDYVTPADPKAEKASKVLPILEGYAEAVRDQDILAQRTATKAPHPAQIRNMDAKLSYVGSEACKACHAAEHAKWSSTPHAHAYDTLVTKAKRPANRQFDPECLVCHTVGLEYQTGFVSAKATPNLLHNGCENCHGPGSGHAAKPDDPTFLALQSPWKSKPTDKLPDAATMAKIAALKEHERKQVPLTPGQTAVVNAVAAMCYKCHDTENDPKFDIYSYWPKVNHSGLKGKPPAVAAGK